MINQILVYRFGSAIAQNKNQSVVCGAKPPCHVIDVEFNNVSVPRQSKSFCRPNTDFMPV
jgi:hypothetical protein